MVQLVLAGSQDTFLTGSPKITYFISVYYRRTPFFLNTIQVPFTGPVRFGEAALCKIPQTGDVIVGMSLQASLPALGSQSTSYTYVGGVISFTMNVNSVPYLIRVPPGATNTDLNWLNNKVPNLSFDTSLTITYTGTGTATINVVSDDNADILCQENPIFTVSGKRSPDYPLELSPVWSYTTEKNISYVSNTGNKLIREATLKIGGQTIKRIEGEYLTLKEDLDVSEENQFALTALVGKNDTQLVADTKPYLVPLDFTEFLPVCALQRHDLQVDYQFEQFSNLIPYDGLGELSYTSYSTKPFVSVRDALLLSPNIFISTSTSNVAQFDSNVLSNTYTGVNPGQIRNLFSNLFTYDGAKLTKDSGTQISVTANAFGSDTQSNLYLFNVNSNLVSIYSNTLSLLSNVDTFSFPPGFATSTVKYINVSAGTLQTSTENLTIRSNALLTQNTITINNFTASPTVPFVSNITWSADLNANAYFSNSRTFAYNLGSLVTSNVFTIPVSDYTFNWRVTTSQGTVYDPTVITSTDSVYVDDVHQPKGVANVYYEGNFTSNLTFSYGNFASDPYQTVPSSNALSATFPYVYTVNDVWTSKTLSNLDRFNVSRGVRYIGNPSNPIVSNVLTGYLAITYTGVSASSNALIRYVGPGGILYTTNLIPSDTTINIGPSSYYYEDGVYKTRTTTTTCTRVGTTLYFNGAIPIYSVSVGGVPQVHDPIGGFSNVLQFTGVTYPVSFTPSLTITGPGSGRLDDRTQWVASGSTVNFYGLTDVTCLQTGVTKVPRISTLSNITAEFDRNLVVLSDSTPWQTFTGGADMIYFTGEYWTLSQNLWPLNMSITAYDVNNNPTVVTGTTETDFRSNVVAAGYATGVTSFTFQNCAYLKCTDIRSRLVLGLGSNVTVPVTYYSSPSVTLDPGGRPVYSGSVAISAINAKTCTDTKNSVYSASNTSPWLLQVNQGGTIVAMDTTGVQTPNGSLVSQKDYVTVLTEGTQVYFVARDGTVVVYDNSYEFGQVGSMRVMSTGISGIYSGALTNRYLALNTKTSSNIYYVNKLTGASTIMQGIGQQNGLLVWDGARYLYEFGPTNSVVVVDTILYTNPTFVNTSMLIEYALVSEEEREWFQKVQFDQLFKQLQVSKFLIKAGTTETQFNLKLKNLVTELMFTIDDDGLDSIELYFNGIPIIDEDNGSALCLSKIQPYEHHRRIPDRPFFMYSFAKKPYEMNPSGFVNMSRIIEQVLNVRVIPSNVDRTLVVWADSYNMMRFRDGLAGVLYDYSTQ